MPGRHRLTSPVVSLARIQSLVSAMSAWEVETVWPFWSPVIAFWGTWTAEKVLLWGGEGLLVEQPAVRTIGFQSVV